MAGQNDTPRPATGDAPADAAHIPLDRVRWRLALIWFPASGVFVLLLIAQAVLGAYGQEAARAFSWALPNFLPTLSLMVSVFAADALKPADAEPAQVRRGFAALAVWLSVFYFVLLLGSLLIQPFAGHADTPADRLRFLEMSNLWLAPLQSLVVLALGVLFFLKKPKPAP